MSNTIFITHANIQMDADVPVPDWHLSDLGRARHEIFNQNPVIADVKLVFSSEEQKAIDGADILSAHLSIKPQTIHDLHENDRSSTGFLPPDEFEKMADSFFENFETSVKGWEKAIDAQQRIFQCVTSIIKKYEHKGDIAIVSHGGVGTLLRCKLLHQPIDRKYDQPSNGGGNYFVIDSDSLDILCDWIAIDQ
jgi:broad specificity phosphatase PhoE